MSDSETALEHLKVIRGLMEKATVYRAVTVPTALVGGSLAIITAGTLGWLNEQLASTTVITVWLGVLLLVNAFHHGLIWRTARQEGEPYLSPGLHMALKTILPPMFVGGVLGITLGYGPPKDLVAASLIWTTFYGLSLLATHGFSPRSLRVLGLAFTLTGSLWLAVHWWRDPEAASMTPQRMSALIMGVTFGIYHLIYGLCVRSWQRSS